MPGVAAHSPRERGRVRAERRAPQQVLEDHPVVARRQELAERGEELVVEHELGRDVRQPAARERLDLVRRARLRRVVERERERPQRGGEVALRS